MSFKFQALVLLFILPFFQYAIAETTDAEDEETVISVIELDSVMQEKMGLETTTVRPVTQPVYQTTYGKVLDLTPLLNFRRDCLINKTKLHEARQQFNLSQKALKRLEQMVKNKAASSRKLEQQHRQWLANQALLQQSQIKYTSLLAESHLRWNRLADIFCQPQGWVNELLSGKDKILAITKPNNDIVTTIDSLQLSFNQNEQAVSVQLLDNIDLFDPVNQTTYLLYKTSTQQLHPGQHFSVYLPLANDSHSGLLIPKNSVIWHLGQAFVYIKVDQEHFQHLTIEQVIPIPQGYLVNDDRLAGKEIVVTGAQLLLSVEFRSQIADEDDD